MRSLLRCLGVLALALAATTTAAAQTATASWLDGFPTPWNTVGGAVPAAVPPSSAAPAACAARERPALGPEEAQLAGTGWRFLDAWQSRTVTVSDPPGVIRVTVMLATSGYDGMCRPAGFNAFVSVDGRFAGTLSPVPMDSRADGTLRGEPTVLHGSRLEATFTRYAAADPLCCPSLPATRVSYQLVHQPAGWVVLPETTARVPAVPIQLSRTGSPRSPGSAGSASPLVAGVLAASALATVGIATRFRRRIDLLRARDGGSGRTA